MNFKDVVMKRRSIRKYTDEPVSEEDLQYILECGMSAPSAVNLQPWYFVVIRSKEQMARLCEVMSDSSDKLSDDLHALFKSHPEVVEETLSFLRKLVGAPIVMRATISPHSGANISRSLVSSAVSMGAVIQQEPRPLSTAARAMFSSAALTLWTMASSFLG